MFRENFHGLEKRTVFAFNKERLHNAVAIENFGPFIDTNLALLKNFSGPNYSGRMTWSPSTMCFVSSFKFHVLPRLLVFFLVKFDLLFAFGVLSCWILDCASLFILYFHEHGRLGFWMLTVETAVLDCICWFSSSCNRKGQSYQVKYCLELVEGYSEGNRVNQNHWTEMLNTCTVYFINQTRGNARISHTEFVFNEIARDCKCLLIFLSFLLRIVFLKNIPLQISFFALINTTS